MRASDRKAFSDLLTDALAFYGQTTSRFALDVWWQACQGFELEQVSIKAKTNKGMGWTGRGEGLACFAVATLAPNEHRP